MKKMKKGLVVLSMLLLSLAIATTGCSDKNAESSVSDNGTKLKPYEVVMVYPDTPQSDLGSVQKAMNDYLQTTYPDLNVSVKLNPIDPGAWADKTNLMMASGDKFDLIFTANYMGFNDQVLKGALLPLDDLLPKNGPDIEAAQKDLSATLHTKEYEAATYKGKIYAVPTVQGLGVIHGVMFNKELVDKYHIDLSVLKSGQLKDLESILKTIKDNEPNITPLVVAGGSNSLVGAFYDNGPKVEWLASPNMPVLDESKSGTADAAFKVVNMYETPSYIEYVRMMHKWYEAGYINKDASMQGIDVSKRFQSKKAFATVSGLDITADPQIGVPAPNNSMTALSGINIIQVPLQFPPLRIGRMATSMQAISRTSEDPARAMMLLNLFFKDKKLLTLFNFGIEGKHYVIHDGQIALPEGKTRANVGFFHDISYQIGNQLMNYTRVGEEPNKYVYYKKFNERIVMRKAYGLQFDPVPVKNELIAIANVKSQFDPGLYTGMLNPDETLPKLLAQLKAAGSEKVIAEVQKQLDAWRAANGK